MDLTTHIDEKSSLICVSDERRLGGAQVNIIVFGEYGPIGRKQIFEAGAHSPAVHGAIRCCLGEDRGGSEWIGTATVIMNFHPRSTTFGIKERLRNYSVTDPSGRRRQPRNLACPIHRK